MKKSRLLVVLSVFLLGFGLSAVAAQDIIPLEFDTYVEGEITESAFEVFYTFTGKAGDLVMIEIFNKPGTYDLSPSVVLRDAVGRELAKVETYFAGVAVAELTADGNYTVVATRYDGADGTSTGPYWMRARVVEPLGVGAKVEASLMSDSEKRLPQFFVLKPEATGAVKLSMTQTLGGLYGGLRVVDPNPPEDTFMSEITLLEIRETAGVSSASFTLELEGGKYYILQVLDESYVYDVPDATVTITVS